MRKGEKKVIYPIVLLTIFVTVVLWIVGFLYISFERERQTSFYLQKYSQTQEAVWGSVVKTHRVGMSAYFDAYILKSDVIKELEVANSGDEAKKAKARANLYELLLPAYDKLQTRNVRQLHFQDRENNSFLRFHQPHNFGDSLNATRPSIVMANRLLKPVSGFETGRVVSGFRNIFPILWDMKHIGSVELSQPFEAMKNAMEELDHSKQYMMIVRASAIIPKLFEENKRFYRASPINNEWLVEERSGSNEVPENIQKISADIKKDAKFAELMSLSKPFAKDILSGGHKYVVAMVPIIDITGEHTATLVGVAHSIELEAIDGDFTARIIYFSFMLLVAAGATARFVYGKKILDKEQKRFVTISQTMGEGLYVINTDGRIRFINQAALEMLRLSEQEAIGAIAHYVFHMHTRDGDVHLSECPIYKAALTGERYEGVDLFKRKGGEVFPVDVISSQLKDGDEVVGSVVVFKDITDRVKLEENLRELNKELENRVEVEVVRRVESDAVFKSIFENSPEGILILNENGRFVECNPVAARMLGYKEHDIIGKRPCDISPSIQPESGFFSENAAKMFIANTLMGEIQRFEWTHLSSDGTPKLFEVMLSPIFRGDKKEILGLWRDITQLKELEKEKEAGQALLIQQSKLAEMGMMIGAIAHQWKQPLNAIWLMTQDVKMAYDYGELTSEYISNFKEGMGEQIRFMTQTIENFRNFYKPSIGRAPFSVDKAVRSVLSMLEGQLKKEEIDIVVNSDDSIFIDGLENEFKQVLLNILNNAKDALCQKRAQNRKIIISLSKKEFEAVLSITDNAGGIDEELLDGGKIFEPYNTTKGEHGTGIGLSLSKIIIEQKMNGKLEAYNVDGGAEFLIRLAVADNL